MMHEHLNETLAEATARILQQSGRSADVKDYDIVEVTTSSTWPTC